MSVYFDRHTTYKSTAKPTIEEEINGEEPLSEFGRALKEFSVGLFAAGKGKDRKTVWDTAGQAGKRA